MQNNQYTKLAIILHWLIALGIFTQIFMGLWMVEAIKNKITQPLAFEFYQLHKSIGLTILLLVLARFMWRLGHTPPALPDSMTRWEVLSAKFTHYLLYILTFIIPLFGWLMVSINPYGLTTMFFNLFQWPDINFLSNSADKPYYFEFFKSAHKYTAYLIIFFIVIHIIAALKHHFINKDDILKKMVPFLSIKNNKINK